MANKKSSTSTTKAKDSKAPKRRRSAYILFTIDKRPQVKLDNPGLLPKEILSELGALWKAADAQTKQHYQKLSDKEKAELEHKPKVKKENSNNTNQSMEVNSSQ